MFKGMVHIKYQFNETQTIFPSRLPQTSSVPLRFDIIIGNYHHDWLDRMA